MHTRRVALLAALAGASVLCCAAVTACSSDHPPGSGSSSSSGSVADGGGGNPDGEAGLPQLHEDLCKGLVPADKVIDELSRRGDPPPPLGGAIALGKYDLDELYIYGGVDAGPDAGIEPPNESLTGRSGSGSLVVTKNTLAFLEAYGPAGAPAAATGYAYSAEATTISAARVCPETVATKAIPYSAVGDSLALFVDPNRRVVFRRKPEQ